MEHSKFTFEYISKTSITQKCWISIRFLIQQTQINFWKLWQFKKKTLRLIMPERCSNIWVINIEEHTNHEENFKIDFKNYLISGKDVTRRFDFLGYSPLLLSGCTCGCCVGYCLFFDLMQQINDNKLLLKVNKIIIAWIIEYCPRAREITKNFLKFYLQASK